MGCALRFFVVKDSVDGQNEGELEIPRSLLRAHLAGMALQGLAAGYMEGATAKHMDDMPPLISKYAVAFTDALLTELERTEPDENE